MPVPLDAQPGDSSSPVSSSSPDPSAALASASPEALNTWRMTGELPSADASPAEDSDADLSTDADSTPAIAAESAAPPVDAVADSSPVKLSKSDKRFQELLADRAKERARADTLERRLAQLERASAPPPAATPKIDATPAASSAAADADPEPDPKDETTYPDGQYDRKFYKDQSRWETRQLLREDRQAQAERQQQSRVAADEHRINQSLAEKIDAGRLKHADFDVVAFAPTEIIKDSPIDRWILESPEGAEVLYALQKTPAEIRRIASLPPIQQLRELAKFEHALGVPVPLKTISDAPTPPRTLGDRSASTADAASRAVRSGDTGAFLAAENARELAQWKASHR